MDNREVEWQDGSLFDNMNLSLRESVRLAERDVYIPA